MAKVTVEDLLSSFGEMTLLELTEFTRRFEAEFGVSAAAPTETISVGPGTPDDVPSEPTEFAVTLSEVGPNKIQVIKTMREVRKGMSLGDAKSLVESAPVAIATGLDREFADSLAARFEAVGASMTVVADPA